MTVAETAAGRSGSNGTGLTLAVVSAATFGTSGTLGSSLIDAGWSPAAAVLARIAASALILTIPALLQLRGRWVLLRRAAGRIAAYGLVAVAGCQLFYFNAIQRMPVGVALLLEYLGTILVVGWLWLRHGQRPRRLTVAGAVAAVAGLVMVLNLTGPARIDPIGVMWGLLAAVGLAIYFLLSALPGQLGRAGAGAVAGGCGDRLCRGHRRRSPARAQTRLVRRHGRGAVRDPVRVAAARSVAVRSAVPGRSIHPRRSHSGTGGRTARQQPPDNTGRTPAACRRASSR